MKPLSSGHLRDKVCPLSRGVRYWEIIQKRLSHLGLNVLSAIHGMSAIRDVCYQACNFIKKETLAQVFYSEFCDIFKSTFFYRTPLVAAFKFKTWTFNLFWYHVRLWRSVFFYFCTKQLCLKRKRTIRRKKILDNGIFSQTRRKRSIQQFNVKWN